MGEARRLWQTSAGRALLVGVAALALLVAVAIALLWPREPSLVASKGNLAQPTERAAVVEVREFECPGPTPCQEVTFEIATGDDAGERRTLPQGGSNFAPELAVGDRLRVVADRGSPPVAGEPFPRYSLVDFDRGRPLLILAAIFTAAVLLVAGLRGVGSLLGLAASILVVAAFIVPSIAAGNEPVLVALAGAAAIMLITIPTSHGLGAKAISAVLGTTAALALATALAAVFFEAASITGLTGGEAGLFSVNDPDLSLRGLALAGAIVASLGVLDDATVSQSSVVTSLRRANPGLSVRGLFSEAMSVGRDHVTAMVNTLVLAYAGASLPLLLLFSSEGASLGSVLNAEVVAVEVLATLVGSIAVIAAVPLTTLIGAALARRLPPSSLPAQEHPHHH